MGPVGAYVFLSDCLTHDCGVPYLKALTHPLRRAWLLCAVEPTLWDPVCKSCALPLSTGYLFGQALASRHPLFFQWVTRERDSKRKRTIFELKIWPGTHSLLSCPRMCILGELSRIHRVRLEYLHGSVGCCKWTTLTSSTKFGLALYLGNIMHVISCTKFVVSFIWKENYFGGMAVFTFGIEFH